MSVDWGAADSLTIGSLAKQRVVAAYVYCTISGAVISGFDPVQTSGVQCNRLPGCRMAGVPAD
jgi:hypothetical protein